jgi:hypothetical protein
MQILGPTLLFILSHAFHSHSIPSREDSLRALTARMQGAHSDRAHCASKTGRQAVLSLDFAPQLSSLGERLGASATAHRPSPFLSCAVREHSGCPSLSSPPRLPASSSHASTLHSREASLTALHCARSTSTVFACALREQDRASGLPLSSIPIP